MALIPWEPFRAIDNLQRQMNRLFDSLSPTTTNKENLGVAFIVEDAKTRERGDVSPKGLRPRLKSSPSKTLHERFQSLEFRRGFSPRLNSFWVSPALRVPASLNPPAEIQENPEAIQLKLEIPGREAKDLDVQVTAEAVSISGECQSEIQTEEKGVTRTEFRSRSLHPQTSCQN